MKTIVFLIASLISLSSFGQMSAYTVYADSIFGCVSNVGMYLEGGTLEENGTIYFNWGDGTTDDIDFTIFAGQSLALNLDHSYANSGTYDIEVQVYSGVLGMNFDGGYTETIEANGADECGFAYYHVSEVSPFFTYNNVPLDFTDNLGNTTTISPGTNFQGGYYYGLNPANAPYNVSINDVWLSNNNLQQTSADITISSFQVDGWANSSSTQFNVSCDVAAANPNFLINYGYLSAFVAPLETGTMILQICNIACSNSSDVTVSVEMEPDFIPSISGLTNASFVGNVLTFDIENLSGCQTISVPCSFPGTTPAGTQVCFDVTLTGTNDTDLANNSGTACGIILNSYDPNDKQVDKAEILNPDETEELIYKIQFQNDGNYNAVNVKVKDVISENLDLSTLKVLDSKHGVGTAINETTREITFSFNNIYLAPSSEDLDASQGYVIYSIKENDNLSVWSEIDNTAHIYFDFNPAIVTNTTHNVNAYLNVSNLEGTEIQLYPNPASGIVKITGASVQRVEIFDLAGKLVQTTEMNATNEVNIESLRSGVYQMIILSKEGLFNSKLVVQN